MNFEGKRIFFTGTHRRAETRQTAERLEDEHRQIRLGYRQAPSSAVRNLKVPFRDVADEYLDWGNSQGGRGGRPWGKTHAKERKNKLAWWEDRLGLNLMEDLTGILSRVEAALRDVQNGGYNGKGTERAGKTLDNYTDCLRGFCNWAKQRGYLENDPLAEMSAFNVEPKTHRRALTVDEIQRVLEVAPEHRRLLYQVAFTSGLRAGELRALTPENVDLDRSALILDPAWTKNRKSGVQPIPGSLAEHLVEYGRSGDARMLYKSRYGRSDARVKDVPENPLLFVPTHTAREFQKDLEAAGIAVSIPGEGKADFHSWRVTFVTFIMDAGATVKEGQTLARHSTPELTMNVYARTRDERLSSLVDTIGNTVLVHRKRAICVHSDDDSEGEEDVIQLPDIHLGPFEDWWRRRDSNPRPRTGVEQAATCLVRTRSWPEVGNGRRSQAMPSIVLVSSPRKAGGWKPAFIASPCTASKAKAERTAILTRGWRVVAYAAVVLSRLFNEAGGTSACSRKTASVPVETCRPQRIHMNIHIQGPDVSSSSGGSYPSRYRIPIPTSRTCRTSWLRSPFPRRILRMG